MGGSHPFLQLDYGVVEYSIIRCFQRSLDRSDFAALEVHLDMFAAHGNISYNSSVMSGRTKGNAWH